MTQNKLGPDFEATEQPTPAQPEEPIKSKVAYQDYIALGPGRSTAMLHEQYLNAVKETSLKPYATLAQLRHWHRAHKWDDKLINEMAGLPATVSQAAEMDKLDLLRAERQVKLRAIEEWDEVQSEHRAKMVGIGERLLEKAEQMLDAPLYRDEIEEDGMTITRIPVKWGHADVARYIELADKAIRLAAEMDTARTRLTVDKKRAEQIAEKLGLSADDIVRRAEEIAKGLE